MAKRIPHRVPGSPTKRNELRAAIEKSTRGIIESLESRLLMTVTLDANGWTQVTPTPGVSRQIYVSSSSGSDSNNGLSPSAPLATIAKAVTLVRNNEPDWILLKRGDWFSEAVGLTASGVSAQEPMVLTNYGDPTKSRPVIDSGPNTALYTGSSNHYVDVLGINFTTSTHNPNSSKFNGTGAFGLSDSGTTDMLIENCSFSYFTQDMVFQPVTSSISNITVRRNEINDAYSTTGHSEGLYAEHVTNLTIQDNAFDHDGWTTQVAGGGPTGYNHDCYLHSSNNNVVVTGNIFADAASFGLQARARGVVDNNLFINDPYGMSFGLVNGSTTRAGGVSGQVIGNVILEPRVDTVNTYGAGMIIGNVKPGGNTVIANNIVADSHYNAPAYEFAPGNSDANPQQEVGLNSISFTNNTAYNWGYAIYMSGLYADGGTGADGLTGVVISHNNFQDNYTGRIVAHLNQFNPTDEIWSGNTYSSTTTSTASWFTLGSTTTSLTSWQTKVEPTAVNQTIAYADPTRTIESYMASVGLPASETGFGQGAANLSATNWNPVYSAAAVINYIQGGFSISGSVGTPPTAVAAPPSNVTLLNYQANPTPTFTITYTDSVPLDPTNISNASVTVTGAGGISLPVSFVGITGSGTSITATYTVSAINGGWNATPDGTYVIALASPVQDTSGSSVPAGPLGSFQNLADPPPAATPATTPTNFKAVTKTSSIVLSWSDPANDQTGFTLLRATDPNFSQNLQSTLLGSSATGYTDSSAVVGQTYYYELIATNATGPSAPTPTISAMIPVPLPATTPINFTATAKTSGIVLSWSDPANDQTGFTLVRATDANFTQNLKNVSLGASVTSYTDSSAVAGQTYYYELIATNAGGPSAPTTAVSAMIPVPLPATTPINFTAAAKASGIVLSWSDPANDQTGFTLVRATDANFTQNLKNVPFGASVTSYTDSSAVVGQTYYYELIATNAGGNSAPTPAASATMAAPPPATTPINFTASAKVSSIVLSWSDPANDQTGFTLVRATDPNFTQNVKNVPLGATATSFSDFSAVAGQKYYYELIASNTGGPSAPTAAVSATIVAPSPATTPTNFTASVVGSTIVLTWSDPANDQTGFTLVRATDPNFTQNVGTAPLAANVTSYTNFAIVVGQTYYYELFATNAGGRSAPTPVVSAVVTASSPATTTTTVTAPPRTSRQVA